MVVMVGVMLVVGWGMRDSGNEQDRSLVSSLRCDFSFTPRDTCTALLCPLPRPSPYPPHPPPHASPSFPTLNRLTLLASRPI